MPRPKYDITPDDFWFAHKYLARKLHEDYDWFLGCPVAEDFAASDELDFRKIREPEALNDWGERWLARPQWEQLKTAIRAARKRHRDRSGEGKKHVTVSWRAWAVLHGLEKRDGITISELVLSRLESEWAEESDD